MKSDIYTIINEIQDFFKHKNIEILKINFIKRTNQNISESGNYPISTDDNLGVFHFYDSTEDRFYSIEFEKELNEILTNFLLDYKIRIERIINDSNFNETTKIIQNSINYILKTEDSIFLKFPNCESILFEFIQYFNQKYNLSINLKEKRPTEDYHQNFFKIIYKYNNKQLFISLYDMAIDNEIIDDEDINQNEFISTITGSLESPPIKFNVNTILASSFLSSISHIFNNFNGKVIEDSKRFKTKAGNFLTQSNYNKSKNGLTEKNKELALSIKNQIEKILKQHS